MNLKKARPPPTDRTDRIDDPLVTTAGHLTWAKRGGDLLGRVILLADSSSAPLPQWSRSWRWGFGRFGRIANGWKFEKCECWSGIEVLCTNRYQSAARWDGELFFGGFMMFFQWIFSSFLLPLIWLVCRRGGKLDWRGNFWQFKLILIAFVFRINCC